MASRHVSHNQCNTLVNAVSSVLNGLCSRPVTWFCDCVFPSLSFSCNRLFFMFIKSWQVNEQVPALIMVSDFPEELTEHTIYIWNIFTMDVCTGSQTQTFQCTDNNCCYLLTGKNTKLTVVYGDTRTLVWCKCVASAAAAQEASRCVHTLMVTQAAVSMLTLINVCKCVCKKKRVHVSVNASIWHFNIYLHSHMSRNLQKDFMMFNRDNFTAQRRRRALLWEFLTNHCDKIKLYV